jgi:N-acetyl-anhydromuramyl-L-alanine amidase AmpD
MSSTWIGSPNFTSLTRRTVLGAILHSSEGTMAGMNAVFNIAGGASAHYAVARDGRRYQYVREKDVAYHCFAWGSDPQFNHNRPSWLLASTGRYSAVNAYTVGIELEGYAVSGFTAAQYVELASLLREISERHGFPLTLLPDAGAAARVTTHAFLQSNRSDPGALFDWNALRDALQQGEDEMTPEQQRIVDAAGRHNLTDADIDSLSGLNSELAKQVNSLTWLLRTAQGETASHQADADRLRAELVAALNAPPPATITTTVSSATITLSDGRTETFAR